MQIITPVMIISIYSTEIPQVIMTRRNIYKYNRFCTNIIKEKKERKKKLVNYILSKILVFKYLDLQMKVQCIYRFLLQSSFTRSQIKNCLNIGCFNYE